MSFFLDPSFEGFMWVIAIALTVIVLDVFFETEILSVAALLGISVYFSLLFDISVKWKLLIALLCWIGVTALFYRFWKRAIAPLIRNLINTGENEAIHSAVGASAEFRLIEGQPFAYWNGDLWPLELKEEQFEDRQKVIVEAVVNGNFTVREIT